MKWTIRILTVIIILLPVSIIYILSFATFHKASSEWKDIVVKEGRHSYYHSVEFYRDVNEIEFYFKTNDSWYYKMPKYPGWNKVRGFSIGQHRQGSSARLGYRCVDDTLLLVGAYCYINGLHPNDSDSQQKVLDTIYPNQTYHCHIEYEDEKFKFYFEDKYWECAANTESNWGYMLNPFIGGRFTLDHDWKLALMDVKP